jgi:hypothetical protein
MRGSDRSGKEVVIWRRAARDAKRHRGERRCGQLSAETCRIGSLSRPKMSDGEWPSRRQGIRDQTTVAVRGVRFQTQEADRSPGFHELENRLQATLCGCGAKVLPEDRSHLFVLAGASRRPPVRRSSQRVDVDIVDPGLLEVGPEPRLRETRPPRPRRRANVDDQVDTPAAKLLEEAADRRCLVADRGDRFHDRPLRVSWCAQRMSREHGGEVPVHSEATVGAGRSCPAESPLTAPVTKPAACLPGQR